MKDIESPAVSHNENLEHINPYVNQTSTLTTYERVKMCIMTLLLVPVIRIRKFSILMMCVCAPS
jgi:hypothetical protein